VTDDDVFRASAVNRLALADLLESLTPDQLAVPSLCAGWDVATVAAHLGAAITTKIPAFTVTLIRNLGRFDRANDEIARKAARRGISATIATIRENADSRFAPPVAGPRAPLTDVLVHTGDIARPLGLRHDAAADHVLIALEFLHRGRPLGFVGRNWLNGLRLVATDIGAAFGDGAEVRGRGIDVMMAVCGRTPALDDLTGPGVATLRGRIGA
jgi:uncharacterized protein (TIGR03083 family)